VLCSRGEQQGIQTVARRARLHVRIQEIRQRTLIVRRGRRKSELPMHGGRKELGLGLVNKVKRDLGLK
jgi:hypothetical protein